jgi:hypothetical protein
MKVRADRETWTVSGAVGRVRDRLSAEIGLDFYCYHLIIKEL